MTENEKSLEDYSTDKALAMIRAERVRQRGLWSASEDSLNTRNDWVAYITAYVGRAACCARNDREDCDFIENMVKVGALVVAALEAVEGLRG